MSISKEIFGIERRETNVDDPKYLYKNGINDTLDYIDNYELSEEEMADIIKKAGLEWEPFTYPTTPLEVYIAKALKSNKSKLFVRKNGTNNNLENVS